MRNEYLKNLNKIEFVVTDACTGKCKHCSQGAHKDCGARIDPILAADAVRKILSEYSVKTVMTFGGEPLLHTDAVYSIMSAAKEMNIEKRQVITNGFFTKNPDKIREVVCRLYEVGVNDLLLSVDAFHQETIPVDIVKLFAKEAVDRGIPVRLQPAWLVSRDDENPYNQKTRELLDLFLELNIHIGDGNVIFPEGNALEYLSEYFTDNRPENPYEEDECDVRCVSFSADGEVLRGNIYREDVMQILSNYLPRDHEDLSENVL
ncbi:MAG: radical SAM protein [Clostridia bacterium]|nr:radical SAM protein [Clostridia bacterium]